MDTNLSQWSRTKDVRLFVQTYLFDAVIGIFFSIVFAILFYRALADYVIRDDFDVSFYLFVIASIGWIAYRVARARYTEERARQHSIIPTPAD